MTEHDHYKEYPHPVNFYTCRPFIADEVWSRADACAFLKRSPRALDDYAKRFGLGRRIAGRTAYSKVATKMFADGDIDALGLYLRGDRSDPRVTKYFDALGIEIPAAASAGA